MNEVIAQIFFGAAKEAGKLKVAQLLAQIKEHNTPEVYANALKTGNGFFSLLNELAVKTKTKLDDMAIAIFAEAISEAAAADGIQL